MKNQYFGDVHDFRKYCLLRHLIANGFKRLAIAWMLTQNDGGRDGRLRAYLRQLNPADPTRRLDPELHEALAQMLSGAEPTVALLEHSKILPGASYFSCPVPEERVERETWRTKLVDSTKDADLVFVDPDNGIEVPSRPIGRKGSSKYIAWAELKAIWKSGSSLLIYQHFRREKRGAFANRLATELKEQTGAPHVEAFRTPHVLFLLAVQERHVHLCRSATSLRQEWSPVIVRLALNDISLLRTTTHASFDAVATEPAR